jgi:hypothetical protein
MGSTMLVDSPPKHVPDNVSRGQRRRYQFGLPEDRFMNATTEKEREEGWKDLQMAWSWQNS